MKKDKKTLIGCALAFTGLVLMVFGVVADEHREVFEKAVRICLECIGIG